MKRKIQKWVFVAAFVCLAVLLPQQKTEAASKRLFDIVVKDGYTTQTIEMKYGKSPYGYTSYYANQSTIYVNPKAKSVSFYVKRNTSSKYGSFHFSSKKIKPTEKAKANLFTYTVDGKKRAWMFTVQKLSEPDIKYVKTYNSVKGSTFVPKGKRYVKIRTVIKTEIPVKVSIQILNENGKYVYRKNYPLAGSRTYTLKWNGKPSKKNAAKLKTTSYVPEGEYTVKITAILQNGDSKQEFSKESKLKVGKK